MGNKNFYEIRHIRQLIDAKVIFGALQSVHSCRNRLLGQPREPRQTGCHQSSAATYGQSYLYSKTKLHLSGLCKGQLSRGLPGYGCYA